MKMSRGLTLIELLIVLAIVAILTTLAAPSFKRTIQSNTIASGVNTFLSDMRYARSEAIRRGGGVVMCRSDAPEAASPACNTGAGPGNNGWTSGWIIFHDLNNNGTRDVGDALLRVQGANTAINSIVEGGGASTKFRFTATGRLSNVGAVTSLEFGGSSQFASEVRRMVCVSLSGRTRIAGNGSAVCGVDS